MSIRTKPHDTPDLHRRRLLILSSTHRLHRTPSHRSSQRSGPVAQFQKTDLLRVLLDQIPLSSPSATRGSTQFDIATEAGLKIALLRLASCITAAFRPDSQTRHDDAEPNAASVGVVRPAHSGFVYFDWYSAALASGHRQAHSNQLIRLAQPKLNPTPPFGLDRPPRFLGAGHPPPCAPYPLPLPPASNPCPPGVVDGHHLERPLSLVHFAPVDVTPQTNKPLRHAVKKAAHAARSSPVRSLDSGPRLTSVPTLLAAFLTRDPWRTSRISRCHPAHSTSPLNLTLTLTNPLPFLHQHTSPSHTHSP